jgi:mercuric reductase
MPKTILSVTGMSCPSCIDHVKEALSIEGVTSVDVVFERGLVVVEHEPTISSGRLTAALEREGYDATVGSEPPGVDGPSW